MMNSKTNRTDGSKASVVRFAMLLPPSRCLSLEEASLGEGRLTHERTEQETKRVRRLFSNHHGVAILQTIFYYIHFAHCKKLSSAQTFHDKADNISLSVPTVLHDPLSRRFSPAPVP